MKMVLLYTLLFSVSVMVLFVILDWVVYNKLNENNSFRKFWENHMSTENEDDPPVSF